MAVTTGIIELRSTPSGLSSQAPMCVARLGSFLRGISTLQAYDMQSGLYGADSYKVLIYEVVPLKGIEKHFQLID